MNFKIGKRYFRRDIATVLRGDWVSYLPQSKGQVVCGCFTFDHNTGAPEEVQVGNAPKVTQKAELLASQPLKRIPVFLKMEGKGPQWEYSGVYEFIELTNDRSAIKSAEKRSGRHGELSYILRLKKVSE